MKGFCTVLYTGVPQLARKSLVWSPTYTILAYVRGSGGFFVLVESLEMSHTARLDTIIIQITMDVLSGVPGVSNNILQINLLSFCTKIEPKLNNHQKCLFSDDFSNFIQFKLSSILALQTSMCLFSG